MVFIQLFGFIEAVNDTLFHAHNPSVNDFYSADLFRLLSLWTSGNGFAVLLQDGTVSARNIRNIYCVKHINPYILKTALLKWRRKASIFERAVFLLTCQSYS
ncbi:hypothetical protein D3C75_975230 [compost metagenome]